MVERKEPALGNFPVRRSWRRLPHIHPVKDHVVTLAGATVLIDLKQQRLAIDLEIAFLSQLFRQGSRGGFSVFDAPARKIPPGT